VTSLTSRCLPPILAEIPLLAAHRPDIDWQEAAVCRQADPELFFPIGTAGAAAAEIQRAKAICARCPVQRPCLAYALATCQDFGIWGGHDENERRLLHRQRRESRIAAGAGPSQPLTPQTARS
jgi:WhiB family transcriptional regulator, redox-sensing transcriptional regulator